MTANILEIGRFCLFKRVYPETTTWLHPGDTPPTGSEYSLLPPFVTRAAIPSIKRRLRDRDYQLIVYFPPGLSPHTASGLSFRSVLKRIGRRRSSLRATVSALLREAVGIPLVVLDMDDAESLDPANISLLDHCRAYFKREMPDDHAKLFHGARGAPGFRSWSPLSLECRLAKLRPISLGLPKERIQSAPPVPHEKTVDVFFAGKVKKCLVREQGLSFLRSLASKGFIVTTAEGLSLEEYLQRCARAWLVWSPEGMGRDCFRHYEAPLCWSVPVINHAPILRYRPLIDGTHCFYYDAKGDNLEQVIVRALSDKTRLLSMAEEGRAYVLAYHTHEALCRYVLSEVI